MYSRGDIVWGKLRSCPWWPAMVINPQDCNRDIVKDNKCWLFWFGDHQISEVEYSQVQDFKENFAKNYRPKISQRFKRSVQEALSILAARYNIDNSDPSSLFSWADNGFITKLRLRFNESNAFELPNIVMKALKNCGKRKLDSSSEDDSENEIDNLLKDVKKDPETLEDICVACCKSETSVIMTHPLFIGGICQNCKKSVIKIMKCPKGQMNVICVLCGQGGKLVYCSNSDCKSSFCKTCIDYMTAKSTYSNILKNDNWKCFLCEPNYDADCLIRKREVHLSKPVSIPSEKLPIRVIGLSDAALPILKKKKIDIGLYCTESSKSHGPSTSKETLYSDFTKAEILEIRPDFIFGAYFTPTTVVADKKKNVDSFLAAFYKFLFRLNNAQDCKPSVFFMLISDEEILDEEIKSRVTRFIPVNPFIIELPTKKFCIWTNVPYIDGIKDGKCVMKIRTSIEERILNKLMDPLKNFFKQEI